MLTRGSFSRRKKESLLIHKNLVWSFDIDGVLNTYPDVWLNYIKSKTGQFFRSIEEAKNSLKIDYKLLKHNYRLSDFKYSIPADDVAREVLAELRRKKNIVYICSSRPFPKYQQMKRRSIEWLIKQGIEFDGFIEKTPKNLIEKKCSVHVDDELESIIPIQRKGIRCFLYTKRQMSAQIRYPDSVKVIYNLKSLMRIRVSYF